MTNKNGRILRLITAGKKKGPAREGEPKEAFEVAW
jgi:hypothetical protein